MGAAILSAKTGAPIVPAFMLRQVDDRFLLRFCPPIIPRPRGGVDDAQSAMVSCLQDVIGQYPYQWFLFHDFWRSREAGARALNHDRSASAV